jgi:hypothetical protein
MKAIEEKIIKSVDDCGFLLRDLREAQSAACESNPLLALLLLDLIEAAVKIDNRIGQINSLYEGR